jgi:hypothetical protein
LNNLQQFSSNHKSILRRKKERKKMSATEGGKRKRTPEETEVRKRERRQEQAVHDLYDTDKVVALCDFDRDDLNAMFKFALKDALDGFGEELEDLDVMNYLALVGSCLDDDDSIAAYRVSSQVVRVLSDIRNEIKRRESAPLLK